MWIAIALGLAIGSLAGALAGGSGARRLTGFLCAGAIIAVGTVTLVGSTALITGVSIFGGLFPFVFACTAAMIVAYLVAFPVARSIRERTFHASSK
jgi:hypothetical protein